MGANFKCVPRLFYRKGHRGNPRRGLQKNTMMAFLCDFFAGYSLSLMALRPEFIHMGTKSNMSYVRIDK